MDNQRMLRVKGHTLKLKLYIGLADIIWF